MNLKIRKKMNQNKEIILDSIVDLIETSKLNNLFRLVEYTVKLTYDDQYLYNATVFNDQARIKLTWLNNEQIAGLNKGAVIRVVWMTRRIFMSATNIVAGLERVEAIGAGESIFSTLSNEWLPKRNYYRAFLTFLNQMDSRIVQLVQHILLNEKVLYCFLKVPYTKSKYYNHKSGNFMVTTINMDVVSKGHHHEEFQTDRKVLMVAVMMVGIARHLFWEYDEKRKCFFIPPKHHKLKLNILAGRLLFEASKKYKIDLDDDLIHALDQVFKNQALEHKLIGQLW
jgi:hypothetical protein